MRKVMLYTDRRILEFAQILCMPLSRVALFFVFFYFGTLKLLGLSPATHLVEELTRQTIGMQYFGAAFIALALIECLIGVLFLIPRATRAVIPLIFAHLMVACSPLVLAPAFVWDAPFVPNMEGQYIFKNIALMAIAVGIAARVTPMRDRRRARPKHRR
ncbi:hypothetical protein [Nocardia salmonicida]|uniref:hypothetical protein n=2 Tax=Nocardiaceae TaxID=85025 RepID=UPI001041F634|nr:hypothetical protein [Nocardia salmonicida]